MTYRSFCLLSLISLFSCNYPVHAASFFDRVHSIIDTSLGIGARTLAGDKPITDENIVTMVNQAQKAFGLENKPVKAYWIKKGSAFSGFSDAVWGDTIFLNKSAIGDNPLALKWQIWHSMAHIKRHDYSARHIYFVTTAALSSTLIAALVPNHKLLIGAATLLATIPAYIPFVRSLERKTDICAAQKLCENNEKDFVEKVSQNYKELAEDRPAGSRPFIFFQTFQQTYNDLCSVLNNHANQMNQNKST